MIRSSGEYWTKRVFQYLFQSFFVRAFADRFLAVDDGKLELVFDRKRFDVRRGLAFAFALLAGKVVHVFLQRVAIGRRVAVNQLEREINFLLRDFV